MTRRFFWAFGVLVMALASPVGAKPGKPVTSPTPAAAPAPGADKTAKPAQPGWTTRCQSAGRTEPMDCSMDESAVLTRTGEIVVAFSLRVPKDANAVPALIQIPTGIFIPGGVTLQVDDKDKLDLTVNTCEQRGCFAAANLSTPFLDAMRGGKDLKVSFDNLNRQRLTVPLPLNGFGPAFDKIK